MEQTQQVKALKLIREEWMSRTQGERKTKDQAIQFLFQLTIREPEKTRHLRMGFSELLELLLPDAENTMN